MNAVQVSKKFKMLAVPFAPAVRNMFSDAHEITLKGKRHLLVKHQPTEAYMLRQLGLSGPVVPGGHVPTWLLPWGSVISAGYIGFILMTLTARQLNPVVGRRLTRVLNWALVFAPPFGTMVGVYGLMKMDREMKRQPV